MEKINLEVLALELNVESRGVAVLVDLNKIPHDVLRQVLAHGVKQKVSDAASNAAMTCYVAKKGKDAPKPSRDQLTAFVESNRAEIEQETLASMEKARNALYEGRWQVREGGGTVSRWTDEQALALNMARDALMTIFKAAAQKAGKKSTMEALCELSPKIAAFFDQGGKRPTWKDTAVMEWIAAQAEKGTDYLAQAREELARRETLSDNIDVGDLLDGL